MKQGNRIIVACRIMEPELEKIQESGGDVEIRYLDQGLHMTPRKMGPAIQAEIDRVPVEFDEIVLGYGLCANGIVGVKAPKQGLYVPKTHDCIALFMGSFKTYRAAIKTRPGTFYLTAGWVEDRKDPLGYMEDQYIPRMGRKMAEWGMKEELKHYSHFTLINTGAGNMAHLREQALKNAAFFDKKFDEISGSAEMFWKMINGSLLGNDFLFIKPGVRIRQNLFLDYGKKTSTEKTDPDRKPSTLQPTEVSGAGHPGAMSGSNQ